VSAGRTGGGAGTALTPPSTGLASRWRTDAAVLRLRGAAGQADTLESCAAELEESEQERESEALTLEEGAAESG